jgi:hypothetical protein
VKVISTTARTAATRSRRTRILRNTMPEQR